MDIVNLLLSFFQNPFVLGLLLAFAIFFTIWRDGLQKTSELRRELRDVRQKRAALKNHVETQMAVESKDLDALDQKVKMLQQENETLREEVEGAKRTDHGQDRRLFHVYVGARARLAARTPGFAEAWERTLAETEKEFEPVAKGMGKFMKDWMPSGLTKMFPAQMLTVGNVEEGRPSGQAPLQLEQGENPPSASH